MGLKKLVVELTSVCNLSCEYCFKELGTSHLSSALLERVLAEARLLGATKITYAGGEPSLYPYLDKALGIARTLGYRYALVTNGWHFPRIFPLLDDTRAALNHVFFSLDSAEENSHDRVRGQGSYQRIMTAAELCRNHNLPFSFLVVLNRKNFHELEELSLLASRLGAAGLRLGHLLPTSERIDAELSLSDTERRAVEKQAQKLDSTRDITISFAASASNDRPGACCETFAGYTASIDCHGRLSLCCQLADYRGGAANQSDIIADLRTTGFAAAYTKFLARAAAERTRRDKALAAGVALARYPCHFCASSMQKANWPAREVL